MAQLPVAQAKQVILDALPVSGEMAYDELVTNLTISGNRTAIRQFHDMRRKGEVQVFLDKNPDGKGAIMRVARPGYTRPDANVTPTTTTPPTAPSAPALSV